MSDKTNRKSGAVRRQERIVRENQEKRKTRRTAIIVVVVLAVLFCSAMLINSSFIRRHSIAVSAGSLKFSPAEFDYFYNAAYSEYQMMIYQSMSEYADQFLPQQGVPLESQVRSEETGETWADYFKDSAMTNISRAAAVYDAAKAAGFTLSDEKRAEMESDYSEFEVSAEMYGYASIDKYLQDVYGKSMNQKIMKGLAELLYTVDAYSDHVRDSFNYTDDVLDAYYDENRDMQDTFTYRYMHIPVEDVGAESDYATTEEYEQAKTDAIAAALAKGEEIAAGISSEQDFIDAARAFNPETYELDDSTLRHYKGELLGDTQGTWLRAPERKEGDVTAIEFTSGCYVDYYISRSSNDYNLANLRQLAITPASVSADDYEQGEEDAAYIEAVEKAKQDAKDQAETVFAAFESGGVTEEKFIELIAQYSSDTTEGGLYENVYRYESEGRLSEVVNEWPFTQARSAGDYELIGAEDGSWYIVYLLPYGEQYSRYIADTKLREQDYNAWDEEIGRPDVKKHWAFVLTQ